MRSTSGWEYSQRVVPGAVVACPLGAEVEAADELTHDHHVDPVAASWAKVRVDAQLLAQREEPLLGADGLAFELWQPDGGEQHGIRRAAGRERLVGQRRALREDGVAAERMGGVRDPERVEHPYRLRRDLRPDPVARKHGDDGHRAGACERSYAVISASCCSVRPMSSRPLRSR